MSPGTHKAYLCHESCKENGIVIGAAAGLAKKIHFVHARGGELRQKINDPITIESVRDNWHGVVDMTDATHINTGSQLIEERFPSIRRLKGSDNPVQNFGTNKFGSKDLITYALGVGASLERPREFKFLYERHQQFSPIPTVYILAATHLVRTINWDFFPGKHAAREKFVHGEQYLEVLGNVPLDKTLHSTLVISDVLDKGDKGGVVVLDVDTFYNDKVVFRNQIVLFAIGSGNFGGPRNGKNVIKCLSKPERTPDLSACYKTSVDQAAFYRLSGDFNPLHIDPEKSKLAGFDQPILHGMSTLGISVRIVLGSFANYDSSLFKSVKARFQKPVIPGQTLRVDMWVENTRIYFETVVVESNIVAISGAHVDLKSVKINSSVL